jgi:XTP/dITP diphosphohydrolase
MPILFATRNAHKAVEVRALLGSHLPVVTLDEVGYDGDPPETSDTFEGNALQKARDVFARTGQLCVADDSGLEVAALGGAPGVHSRRFSPEQTAEANNALLLARLDGVVDRRAAFRCVIAVVGPHGERTASGRCEGRIGHALQGTQGFGYDPLFWPDETPGRAMAELTLADKNRISHRGRAFAQLASLLDALGGVP